MCVCLCLSLCMCVQHSVDTLPPSSLPPNVYMCFFSFIHHTKTKTSIYIIPFVRSFDCVEESNSQNQPPPATATKRERGREGGMKQV